MLVVGCGSSVLLAQEDKDPIALFNEASDLAEKGQLQDAIAIWLIVADDIPDKYKPVVQVNLGLAFKKTGKLPEAWHHLNVYADSIPDKDDEAVQWIGDIEQELSKTHHKISVSCEPEDARLSMQASKAAYRCPLVWWFKPGKQVLSVSREGYKRSIEVLNLTADGKKDFLIKLKPIPGTATDTTTLTKKPEPAPRGTPWWKWALVGGGGVLVASGAVLQVVANGKNEDLRNKYPDGTKENLKPVSNRLKYQEGYENEVQPLLFGAYGLYGVGAAAAIVGGVLLFLDGGDDSRDSKAAVGPLLVPGGSGVSFHVSF